MDATTPQRGDDESTPARPADPSTLSEPLGATGGSTAVDADSEPTAPASTPEAQPVDEGPEDPTAPDTAVEATLTAEPAGTNPNEPVVPTESPDEVQVAAPPTADPEPPAPPPVPATAHVAAVPAATDAQPRPAAPAHDVVFVSAPTPPKKKGNRGMGVLLAALSALVFLVVYVGVVVLINLLQGRGGSLDFLARVGLPFYIPVLLFAIAFIVLALIVNRAGWWSFVLGSFFVGAFVYLGTVALLLLSQAATLTPDAASAAFRQLLISPIVVAAGLVAREVALWVGAAISARGRRVTARNAEARAQFDREQAEHRAEIERTGAVVRSA